MATDSLLEPVGSIIAGRYRLLEQLGRGGMAVVYRAVDERSGQQLAIKRCAPRDPKKLQRYAALLEREYHTLSQLAHPRIIAVHDYGLDARGPYYTMELLDRSDLEHVERLPWQRVCALMVDVGYSLSMLHSRGLLHRDISLRNVCYAPDGHVKLIDFGAMLPMGVARDTVGTPPFLAPEALQLQALDARVDLYALGALGYRLLTGRHAYAARRLSDLRDAWRSRPQPPAAAVPDLPQELSALVLRLLSLDRGARPQRAAEVIEQLERVLGLPQKDSAGEQRAYLTMPTLVGRKEQLVAIRRRVLGLVRGDGGVLLVRGAPGSGRSRMLDACVLEAKLLGASIVRLDRRDSAEGDWGVARALGQSLIEQFPDAAQRAARLSRQVIGQLLPELNLAAESGSAPPLATERATLIRELRDWVLEITSETRLLLVVDDIDRIDESSIGVLSALAHRAQRHSLLVVGAIEQSSSAPMLRLLREVAQAVELPDLSGTELDALLRSVFGDVPNLSACAMRIHGLSHGNPRTAMELAQHLVDSGRARYAAGQWTLPSTLDERDLPSSLTAALATRLATLSPDAQELAAALAISEADPIPFTSYAELTEHGDTRRVFEALGELTAARIIAPCAERYTFEQRGTIAVLEELLPSDRSQELHRRVARTLRQAGGDALRRVHHLLLAGLVDDAIALLSELDLENLTPPIPLLTRAIAAGEQLGLPAATLHRLRMALFIHAAGAMAWDAFRSVAPVVLGQLEKDSGLARYRELGHLPDGERLKQALIDTDEAHLATPPEARVNNVEQAIRQLGRVCGAMPGIAGAAFDAELLESLPNLVPLFPLSPALPVVAQLIDGSREWIRGRMLPSLAHYHGVLERISQPDHAGLDAGQHQRTHEGLTYALGMIEANLGWEEAEERAAQLETRRNLRVNALRIRALRRLALGNAVEARKLIRRAELLYAQQTSNERYPGTTAGLELSLYSRLGDVAGVRSSLEIVRGLAERHAGWRPVALLGQSRYAELQGDLPRALTLLEEGLATLQHPSHPFYFAMLAQLTRLLCSSGQPEAAVARARDFLQRAREAHMPVADLLLETALAYGKLGDFEPALRAIDEAILTAEGQRRVGLALGMFYETRARIAVWMGDGASFELFTERTRREYQRAHNPDLSARLMGLLQEARERGLLPNAAALRALSLPPLSSSESELETVHSRIAECMDRVDRARCALTLLMQGTYSSVGQLFGVHEGLQLEPLASLPNPVEDPGITSWITRYAQSWLQAAEEDATVDHADNALETRSDTAEDTGKSEHRYRDREGRTLELALLVAAAGDERVLTGVLVVVVDSHSNSLPSHQLCKGVAQALLEHGDCRGERRAKSGG